MWDRGSVLRRVALAACAALVLLITCGIVAAGLSGYFYGTPAFVGLRPIGSVFHGANTTRLTNRCSSRPTTSCVATDTSSTAGVRSQHVATYVRLATPSTQPSS